MNESTTQGERRIRIDAEISVRFLVPVITIGVTLITHFVAMSVLRGLADEGISPSCIVLPLDVVVFLAVGFLSDRALKRWMPVRRYATLNDEALVFTDGRHKPPQVTRIAWADTLNVKAWYAVIRRRSRVPKGWYCLSIQLLQDESNVIFYTFLSPKDAQELSGFRNFIRLRPRKEIETNTNLAAVAEQRRLIKLEDERWNNGGEISPDDFRAMIDTIRQAVPDWLP